MQKFNWGSANKQQPEILLELLEYYDDLKGYTYISIHAFDFGLNLFLASGCSADVFYVN